MARRQDPHERLFSGQPGLHYGCQASGVDGEARDPRAALAPVLGGRRPGGPRPRRGEAALIEDQGPPHTAHSQASKFGRDRLQQVRHGPLTFGIEERIASRPQDEVALQDAVADRRGGLEARIEGRIWPQQHERGSGGDELHVGGRPQGDVGVDRGQSRVT